MNPDFEDAFAKGCGWLPRRATFILSSLVVGSQVGGASLLAGIATAKGKFHGEMFLMFFASPVLLISNWLCLNIFVLIFALVWFWRSDALSFRGWGIFAGLESVFSVLGLINEVQGPRAVIVTWVTWLLLNVMMGTGLWFLKQWQMNHWAGEIAMMKAENASRLAELSADPGDSAPPGDEDPEDSGKN